MNLIKKILFRYKMYNLIKAVSPKREEKSCAPKVKLYFSEGH